MNVGEYGLAFNLDVNYDISAAQALAIAITRPDGTVINGVPTVGAVDLATPLGTFSAHQYAVYVFQSGDLNQAGSYSARLTYTDANKRLITPPTAFTVNT